jgi:hypothetical protein
MERRVSDYLWDLAFTWLNADDDPSAESERAFIERNTIALLSNYQREAVDPRPNEGLGTTAGARRSEIRASGT